MNDELRDEVKQVVLARVRRMPAHIRIHSGSGRTLSKDDLIKHIEADDELGREFVLSQLDYMRMWKKGEFDVKKSVGHSSSA